MGVKYSKIVYPCLERFTVALSLALVAGGCRFGYDEVDMESTGADDTSGAGAGGSTSSASGGAASTTLGAQGGSSGASGGSAGSGGPSGTGRSGTGGSGEPGSVGGGGGIGGTTGGGGGVGGAGGTGDTAGGGGGVGGAGGTGGTTGGGGGVGGAGGTGGTTSGGGTGGTASSGGSGGTAPAIGEDPYCERIHRLSSIPIVDGMLDGGLPLQDLPKTNVRIPAGNPAEFSTLPDDVSLRFAVAWFDTGLYFFAEVTDPDRYPALVSQDEWLGDSFEFYVDHDAVFAPAGIFDDPGTRSFTIAAPVNDTDASTRGGVFRPFVSQGPWRGDFIAVPTSKGYDAEAIVVADDLNLGGWNLQPGDSLGFDLSHGVSFPAGEVGPEGRRLGHYFLQAGDGANGDQDYPFYNSGVDCVPILADTP